MVRAYAANSVQGPASDLTKDMRSDPTRRPNQDPLQLSVLGRAVVLCRLAERGANLVDVTVVDDAVGQCRRTDRQRGLQNLSVHTVARPQVLCISDATARLAPGDSEPGDQDLRPGTRPDVLRSGLGLQGGQDSMVHDCSDSDPVFTTALQLEQFGRSHAREIQPGQLLAGEVEGIESRRHGFPIRHCIRKHVRIISPMNDSGRGYP